MKKFIILLIVYLFLVSYTNLPAQELPDRPNILWITCEDMSPHLPSYGDSTIQTPNIDRLAKEGVRYKHVYSTAGVCAPSRAALATGMYPSSIGANNMRTLQHIAREVPYYSVVPPPQVKIHSEYLRAAGYYCINNAKTDYQIENPISAWDESSQQAHWRNRPKNKPFFAIFNFEVTHESRIWVNKDKPLSVDPAKVKIPPYYPDNEIVRKDIARNYSNIILMDQQVGQILKELEEDGLFDKTIIFFYSDHGSGMPFFKREIYDRGLRVPLIVRYPDKFEAGAWNEEMLSFVDFAPTLLSLAGIKIPAHMQGQAFLGKQKANTPRKYIFAARDRMDSEYDLVRAVKDKKYQYVRNYQPQKPLMMDVEFRKNIPTMQELLRLEKEGKLIGTQQLWFQKQKVAEELYDVEKDPFQLHNLAENPAYLEKLSELKNALDAWLGDIKDLGFTPEKEIYLQMWPGGIQPQTPAIDIRLDKITRKISVTCPEPGVSLVYKMENDKTWLLYTEPFPMPISGTIEAQGIRYGYKPSGISRLVIP